MHNRSSKLHATATLLLAVAGCSGAIAPATSDPAAGSSGGAAGAGGSPRFDDDFNRGAGGRASTPAPAVAELLGGGDRPGPRLLVRLSSREYRNTVRDLLGLDPGDQDLAVSDTRNEGGFLVGGNVSAAVGERLVAAAEDIGVKVLPMASKLAPCSAADQRACAQTFLKAFTRRAFRRPPTADELTSLAALYDRARTDLAYGYDDAIRVLVQAVLLAPQFLYHWEAAPEPATAKDGLVRLGPHEVASRLSYLLWSSMPDADLFAAADANALATSAQIQSQLDRMLADARAKDAIGALHQQWLGLHNLGTVNKDKAAFPEFSSALLTSMARETAAFADDVVFGGGTLADLLTASYSIVDGPIASLYGVSAPGSTGKAMLNPAQRAGILTQPAFLAKYATSGESHPVQRGKAVFTNVLCGTLPPQPQVVPEAREPAPNLSTRERYAEHGTLACAKACHENLDPYGFAFEHYDALGKWRDADGGKPVDASGAVTLPSGKQASFSDAIGLMREVASSDDARACITRTWTRFALQRLDGDGDGASMRATYASFESAGFALRALLPAIATSRSFHYRALSDGEVSR